MLRATSRRWRLLLVWGASAWLGALAWGAAGVAPGLEGPRDQASEFFQWAKVHTVHWRVTAKDWDAMEPKRGAPSGPGPGGMGGPAPAGAAPGRVGLAAMMGLEFPQVPAVLELDGETFRGVGVRYKGNGTYVGSQNSDKRPFKVRFDRENKQQRFRGLTTLNFHNSVFDPGYTRETLGYAVCRAAGLPAPRTTYARVYLTIEGRNERHYLGLYTVTEQVDELFLSRWFGAPEGLLLKPGTRESFDLRGSTWKDHEGALNPQTAGTPELQARAVEFVKVLQEGDDAAFAAWVDRWMNVENTARFLALNVALSNLDSILGMGQNFYAYFDGAGGRMHWWIWDQDLSWGSFPFVGTPETRAALSIREPWQGEVRVVKRLLGVPSVRTQYREELKRLVEGPLSVASVRAWVDTLAPVLKPAITEEGADRWAGFEAAVYPRVAGSPPPPAPAGAFGAFSAGSLSLLDFVAKRNASIVDQLAGRSDGEVLEGMSFGGGPPREGGERRGPGGGGPGRGRGEGGMARFAAMPYLQDGDRDQSGDLTREEFTSIADRWYTRWDTNQAGAVNQQAIADGINRNLGPMGPGGGGAAAGMRLRAAPAANPMMGGGPGSFLAPMYLRVGDQNGDGKLTQDEVRGMFGRWWTAWDADHDGKLVVEEIGDGMRALMPPMGGPGGGPGPGGPGGAPGARQP